MASLSPKRPATALMAVVLLNSPENADIEVAFSIFSALILDELSHFHLQRDRSSAPESIG